MDKNKDLKGKAVTKDMLTPAQQQVIGRHVEEAQKTTTTGHEINPANQQDAAALRVEFLDDEITMLTWSENDLGFYKDVERVQAESTVAQYVVYTKHGEVGPTRFVREIGVAPKSSPNLTKKKVDMKFLSDTKSLSLASQIVDNITDIVRLHTQDGIANIAKTIEWASFYGDSDLSDNPSPGSGVQFDGLVKLIDEHNHIDLRGEVLTEEDLNHAAVAVGRGYGTATDAYMPIGVQAEFINKYLNRQIQPMNTNSGNVDMGFNSTRFLSARGPIRLHGSTVMDLENVLDEHYVPEPTAPMRPNVTASVQTNANGKFREKDLKAQEYRVVAYGEEAKSAPSEIVSAAVTASTDAVDLEIEINGMYQQRPQFVNVYRKGEVTGEFYLIGRVPAHEQVNGKVTFTDVNDSIPETADVFVGEMSPQTLHLFELLPITRLPLAQQNAAINFSILWYGALALRRPKSWVRLKNVGYLPIKGVHNTY